MPAAFLICTLAMLSGTAYIWARRAGDAFRFDVLAAFAAADMVLLAFFQPPVTACIVLACVGTCAATDASCGYIYDAVTYPSLFAVLGVSLLNGTFGSAISWALIVLFACVLLHVITGGRGLGLGDVKLFTVVAAGVSSSIGEVFGGSFVIGACFVGIAMLRRRLSFGETVPFAPFIALATMVDLPFRWVLR